MKTTFKIQITLIILIFSLFGVFFTKTVNAAAPASYQKVAGHTYLRERAGKCQSGYLVDKYDAVVEHCNGGAACTTVQNEDSGEMEVGCFVQKEAPPPPEAPKKPIPIAKSPAVQITKACPLTPKEYNQCGGTTGLEDKLKNHTYHIVAYIDCNEVVKKYDPPEDLGDHGQCITYKVATSELALRTAPSFPYISGGVTVSVPSDVFSIDPTPGKKAIFVQFLDANDQPIKFDNNSNFDVEYIDLEKPAQAIATIETPSSVNGTNKTWQPTSVKVTLANFKEINQSIAGVFVRQQTGQCSSIENCGGLLGWTKIKTYGTNGTDSFNWTPNPGDLSEGIHMFGLFSLNPDGNAKELLLVSSTNYVSK